MHARLKGLQDHRRARSARASKIPEQPLDPKIVEAAFKLWGWTPGKKNNNNKKRLNAPSAWFGSHRTIGHGWPADRALAFLPMMQKQQSRIFAGWWVVAGAFLCMMTGYAVAYSFAAFFGALESEFGARRGETSLVFSISAFLYFLLGFPAGLIADRTGPRPVVIGGLLLVAVGPRRRRPGEQPVADLSRLRRSASAWVSASPTCRASPRCSAGSCAVAAPPAASPSRASASEP